jgi:hypothetical protein
MLATTSRAVRVEGAREIAAEFELDARELDAGIAALTRSNAEELRRRIQANAMTGAHAPGLPHIPGTGPGPNVATGDYVRSWRVTYRDTGGRYAAGEAVASASVWTDAAQANRLEHGFWGLTDSLGRTFHQPPYPHIAPAVDGVEDRMEHQLDGIVAGILRGVGFGAGAAVFSG